MPYPSPCEEGRCDGRKPLRTMWNVWTLAAIVRGRTRRNLGNPYSQQGLVHTKLWCGQLVLIPSSHHRIHWRRWCFSALAPQWPRRPGFSQPSPPVPPSLWLCARQLTRGARFCLVPSGGVWGHPGSRFVLRLCTPQLHLVSHTPPPPTSFTPVQHSPSSLPLPKVEPPVKQPVASVALPS